MTKEVGETLIQVQLNIVADFKFYEVLLNRNHSMLIRGNKCNVTAKKTGRLRTTTARRNKVSESSHSLK